MHAGIDVGTHCVLWTTVATNKSAETLLYGYSQAVQHYGRPKFIRVDHAQESARIGADMIRVRGEDSYVIVASMHNQVR